MYSYLHKNNLKTNKINFINFIESQMKVFSHELTGLKIYDQKKWKK